MAKGVTSTDGARSDARSEPGQIDQVSAPTDPSPVDLGDMAGLKRGLDDAAITAILEAGYEEDHFVSNVKIGLGALTIGIALLAQFYPKKYPDNWALLLVCLILYSLGSAALSLFSSLLEEETFLITKPRKAAGNLVLRVSSRMPRYSDQYTLVIDNKDNHKPSLKFWRHSSTREEGTTMTKSVTEFYDDKGILHEALFKKEVQKFVSLYERQYKKGK